jgi:hypothetical protein
MIKRALSLIRYPVFAGSSEYNVKTTYGFRDADVS